jgi:sodium transport system permease protein
LANRLGEHLRDIWLIAQKDLLYVSRDPDVLIYTVLVPLVIYPIIFIGANDVAFWIAGRFEKQTSKIAIEHVDDKRYQLVVDAVRKIPNADIVDAPNAMADLRAGKIDTYVTFEPGSKVYVNVAQSKIVDQTAAKVSGAIWRAHYQQQQAIEKQAGLTSEKLRVFTIKNVEIAPSSSLHGEFVPVTKLGGLPLPLVILCAFVWIHVVLGMGPPATIVFAELREKKTIETLMIEPVSRMAMVCGKFLTVWIIGIAAGIMYSLGIALTAGTLVAGTVMKFSEKVGGAHQNLPQFFGRLFEVKNVAPESWLLLVLAIVLNTALCAMIYIVFGARANTFKQAQALITIPMMVLILLPLGAFLPGVELNGATMLSPAMNLFLVLKRGQPNVLLTAGALIWNLGLIAVSLYFTKYLISIEQSSA